MRTKSTRVLTEQFKGYCSIAGCERWIKARGWCSLHYTRWLHHGDPLHTRRAWPIKEWLLSLPKGTPALLPEDLHTRANGKYVHSAAALAGLRVRVNTDLCGKFWVMVMDD